MDRIDEFDAVNNAVVFGSNANWKNANPANGTAGSIPPAEALRHPQEEIVYAIEQAGLTPDEADLTQLWQAIQANSSSGVLKNNLAYPEIETADHRLAITDNADGTLTIDAAQTWLWRGMMRFGSDDFIAADRTVMTVSGKTYHLRWHAPGTGTAIPEATYPNGRFVLKDLTDAGYNPAALAETNAILDTRYDDMLVARVVSDGANASTITSLKNQARLDFYADYRLANDAVQGGAHWSGGPFILIPKRTDNGIMVLLLLPAVIQLDWARSPEIAWSVGASISGAPIADSPRVLTSDAVGLVDATGTEFCIRNRYQEYPIGTLDTNSTAAWNMATSWQGVGNA